MNEHTPHTVDQAYEHLASRLEAVRRKYYVEQALSGALAWMVSVVCLTSILVLLEYVFAFPSVVRTGMMLSGAAIALVLGAWLVIHPVLKRFLIVRGLTPDDTALMVGRHIPAIHDHLLNLLQLARTRETDALYSPELLLASLQKFSEESHAIDFRQIISWARIRRAGSLAGVVALGAVILLVFPGSELRGAAGRLAHFTREYTQPSPFAFTVTPGNVRVIKNESVSITVRAAANTAMALPTAVPKEITLVVEHEGIAAPELVTLHADASGLFTYLSPSLKQGFAYTAESGDVKSETYTVSVTDRPFIRSFAMRIVPPRYTRLPEQKLDENVGDAQAMAGSTVHWDIRPSKSIAHAAIVLDGGKIIPLEAQNGSLHASMTLMSDVGYTTKLEDDAGVANENPIHYMLRATADQPPAITILVPGKDIDIVEDMSVPLQIRIADDYGFSSLKLMYRLTHSKYEKPQEEFTSVSIPLPPSSEKEQIVSYVWMIKSLGLVPEDVVEYHAEVTDNDQVTGPKTAKSESYLLRLPSMEEIFAEADKSQTDAVKTLDESLKEAENLKKELEELDRDVKTNQALDWQKQKKADDVTKQYGDIQKKVSDVSKQMEAMTQDLEKNHLLSPETLKKYAELQKLMQQMNSPEFMDALKKMQEAMKAANPEQLRQAMQNMQVSEDAFRSSIERTMNLLKRIQVEQKTDELVKRVNEMAKNEQELQKETSELNPSDQQKAEQMAQKQNDLTNDLSDVQKELAKLKETMEDLGKQMPMEKMKKAERSANDPMMQQSMKQSAQQLKSGQKQQAMKSQQQASSSMQQLSQDLTQMQEQMLANQMAEAVNGLRKAMQDMLSVSQKQEELKNQSQRLDPNSEQFRENADRQMNLESDLSSIANALSDLSQQSFVVTPEMGKALGKAMGEMNSAMNGLVGRNGAQASSAQGDAMASLNLGATVMQNAMQALQQGGQGGGGSLLQQLQRMSAQQQGINGQTQQLGQGRPQDLTPQQLSQMARLAAEQQAVQKSMEQLNREAQSSPDRNKILGDLKKIADEMKEVVQSLQQHTADEQTQQKQDRILSRMLNAQRSLRERDYEEERKSETGRTLAGKSPAELKKELDPTGLKRDLERASESGYSKEYMDLIRKYYEAIEKGKK